MARQQRRLDLGVTRSLDPGAEPAHLTGRAADIERRDLRERRHDDVEEALDGFPEELPAISHLADGRQQLKALCVGERAHPPPRLLGRTA